MMHDRFLKDILANPDQDAPRLVYADWLEEQGDPRGEFIRVQCALAQGLTGLERTRLREREDALMVAHASAWTEGLRDLVSRTIFRRGFIDGVTMTYSLLLNRGADLFAAAPVRSLIVISDVADGGRPSLDIPMYDARRLSDYLRRLTSLSITLTAASLRQLLEAGAFAELRYLALDYSRLTDRSLEILFASRGLPHLRTLSLRGTVIAEVSHGDDQTLPAWIRRAVQATAMPQLESLDVGDCLLPTDNVGVLRARFGPGLLA